MQQRTVLLVDDEPGIRDSLRRLLERDGWRVATAASPAEALSALSRDRPDAVILDVRMPDATGQTASGLDLLAILRTRPSLATLPVILLTGYFLTGTENRFIQQHGAKVLYKPTDLRTIAGQLALLCDRPEPLDTGTA